MRIGIDVGGTNTDAVLMDARRVLAEVKTSTTPDVTSGIVTAIAELRKASPFDPLDVRAVMIGTTHFINAIVEANRLAPTAAVRLGLPATRALPPLVGWPEHLVAAIKGEGYLCHGGNEYDGRLISHLDRDEIKRVADDIALKGIRSIAVSSVYSPANPELEVEVGDILSEHIPGVAVSLSHELGRMGLLERENATIINACLRELAGHICDGLSGALTDAGIRAPLFLSQNDGTLMDVDFARRYPVATFASGPTNSMRGAAFLSGLGDCAVIDVGGTTSDIGILQNGFPREATTEVSVSGIRTNFRMPDVLSIGIGGGSRVRLGEPTVGPDSVGYRIRQEGLVFGGDTLTATDIAVAAGIAEIGDPSLVAHLDSSLVDAVLAHMSREIASAVDRMRTSATPLPVVAVGGGNILVPEMLEGSGKVHRPEHSGVANAIGAAIAQVGGEVDRMFAVASGTRESVLDAAKQEAVDRAVAAGARPQTVQIVEVEEVPLAYLPGNVTRIRVKAVGDLVFGNDMGGRRGH
ncbi:hydantoinase/oxoprolinase family protein [Actinokineospora globicatena]|uniref:hydantoinase/oxoprolinase family protein n=1 Tax=Actinokineospora globicatena TaxID=103729 RepID=UPI0020A46ECB|nr:hydantoinase/oxoprolinase family protein [Actinokineospora globicatena]MCP2303126.1 Hydantoinase/oxoprolinase [Actinokineospora globicatena]GLW79760.1 hydantoinase [Actinokineospora globicatena]GLW85830.1 hydantoinase [Actinokineospora globicatena]